MSATNVYIQYRSCVDPRPHEFAATHVELGDARSPKTFCTRCGYFRDELRK